MGAIDEIHRIARAGHDEPGHGQHEPHVLQQVVDERQVEARDDAAGIRAREDRRDDCGGHPVSRANLARQILGEAEQHHGDDGEHQGQPHESRVRLERQDHGHRDRARHDDHDATQTRRRNVMKPLDAVESSPWPIDRTWMASGMSMPAQAAETTKGHQPIRFVALQ